MPRPTADLEALLHHAEWLRRLAVLLLADPGDVEDCLQDTWLAALRHPPRKNNALAWLSRVATNAARRTRRDERRRSAREVSVAHAEATPSAQEITARVEIETKLALHVLALEPNQQTAVLLRYYENLPPREIARRLATPLATVKSWLRRALEQLRKALAAEMGADWRLSLAPLLPLGSPLVAGASMMVAPSSLGGSLAMQAKVALTLALVALAGLGLWFASAWKGAALGGDESLPAQRDPLGEVASTADALRTQRVEMEVPPTASASPASVPVAPSEFLVQVLDHEGRPRLDAELQLKSSVWVDGSLVGNGALHSFRATEGDPEARIRIPRATISEALAKDRRFLEQATQPMRRELALSCAVIGAAAVSHLLLDDVPPHEPICLRLPPVGNVRVEVTDAAGLPFAESASLVVSAIAVVPSAPSASSSETRGESGIIHFTAGTAVVPNVALHRRLQVMALDGSRRFAPRTVVIEGPIAPDQVVRLHLAFEAEMPWIRGTLVDEAGAPIASRSIRFLFCEWRSSFGTSVETNGEGRFELQLDHNLRREKPFERLELALLAEGSEDVVLAQAVLAAQPMPETGSLELGVIVLAPRTEGALLAAGVVLDDAGRPLAGVALTFYSVWPIGPQGPREEFRYLSEGLPRETDAQGRFRACSPSAIRGVRVDARLAGYYSRAAVMCEPGRADLELVLVRGATLEGRVLLDPGVEPRAVLVRFSDERRVHAQENPDASGTFRLEALRPGIGWLEAGAPSWPCVRIDGISVEGSGIVQDARTEAIDLRGQLRLWRLRLATRLEDVGTRFGYFGELEGNGATAARIERDGRVAAWIPSSAESVRFALAGFEPRVLRWTPDEQEVLLDAGWSIAVDPPAASRPPEGFVLRAAIAFPDDSTLGDFERRAATTSWIDIVAGKPARLAVPAPGTYAVQWSLRSTLRDLETEIGKQVVIVTAEPREQELRIGPAPSKLARGIAELAR